MSPNVRAFKFLPGGEREETSLTYAELDHQARAIAHWLRELGAHGASTSSPDGANPSAPSTVLVVFPAGLDFLFSFFGCLYAGVIAVPTRYPHPKRPMEHLEKIALDSGATLGLTTREMQPVLARESGRVRWVAAADVEPSRAEQWKDPGCVGDDVAYLQYTSGSTASPKGVVISHRHVLANCEELRSRWTMGAESRVLSWLPHFHDMGLVFGLIESIYVGCPAVFMPPMAFVQKPSCWLEAVSRERITHSAAPNFAYEVCSRIPETQIEGLDLSGWRVATNGAEQVRADTLERFTRRYEPYGFSPGALCPGYGLAENTLMVTSSRPGIPPVVRTVRTNKLREGRFELATEAELGTRLVSSGRTDVETRIVIADPQSRTRCRAGEIGEIWLAGPSVAEGYWQRAELSAEKFSARLADADLGGTDEGPFLRTGDLGALYDGELFVLGRADDLMIIRGANYHPDDLELTVEESEPALQPDGGVVFTVELLGEPRLVVAQEIERHALRKLDTERVVRAILSAVSERHELEVSAVVLLRPRTLPRTHSGKKQRRECRQRFLDGTLLDVETWIAPKMREPFAARFVSSVEVAPASAALAEASGTKAVSEGVKAMEPKNSRDKVNELLGWLRAYAGERINSRLMDERRSIPPYLVLDLGNRGVLGLLAPERYGGLGLDNRGVALVLQQLAAIDLTLGSFVSVNNALGIRPILLYATEEKREELLPILAPGRELASFAVTEPGAGSNVRAIAAEGRPDGNGGWRLWGTKYWSGTASWAGVINTFVQLEGDGPDAPRGITGFVLRQGSPGLRMGSEALTMGLRAMVQNEVLLEGVRVSPADLLGEPGSGMTAAMDSMEYGRFCLSALSLGVMKRCLQLMVRHASRRTISTGKLLDNPVTLMRISDLTAAVVAVESLIELVGERLDEGARVPAELFCACKTAGPEFAWRAADNLVQQLAGRGYIETNLAPQILRDTRILRIFEGPTEPMNVHVGSKLIHTPEALRSFVADDLRQPTIAAELTVAAARVWERCLGSGSPIADRSAAHTWAYAQAGEVATYGILLAAVKYRLQSAPSPQLRRAEEWARLRFDRRLAKALGTTPAEAVFLDGARVEELVAGYVADIGDIEQTLAGEQQKPDRLVRRAAAAEPRQGDGPRQNVERLSPPSQEQPQPVQEQSQPVQEQSQAALEQSQPIQEQPQSAPLPAPASAQAGPASGDAASSSKPAPASEEFSTLLVNWMAKEYGRPEGVVTPADRFSEYGMDSVTAVKLTNALEGRLGGELSPTLVWDYPTIAELATHLATIASHSEPGPVAAVAHVVTNAPPAETCVAADAPCAAGGNGEAVNGEPVNGESVQDDLKMLAQLDEFSDEELRSLLKQFPEV